MTKALITAAAASLATVALATAVLAASAQVPLAQLPKVDKDALLAHVKVLASDEFEGRAPGTRVTGAGSPMTSRASSRSTRKVSPPMRNATPIHSCAAAPSRAGRRP